MVICRDAQNRHAKLTMQFVKSYANNYKHNKEWYQNVR